MLQSGASGREALAAANGVIPLPAWTVAVEIVARYYARVTQCVCVLPFVYQAGASTQKTLGELGKVQYGSVRLTGYRLEYRRTQYCDGQISLSAGSSTRPRSRPRRREARHAVPRPPWWRARYAWPVRSRWRCSSSRMPVLALARPASAHWRAERGDAAWRKASDTRSRPQPRPRRFWMGKRGSRARQARRRPLTPTPRKGVVGGSTIPTAAASKGVRARF